MCGIAGYMNRTGEPLADSSCILEMLRIQKHRGPDDSGARAFSLTSGESAELETAAPRSIDQRFEGILGFNRLSILDLSHNGHQPMVSPDEKVLLTLNGEIYNAFDFQSELEEWGYRFKSTSDTEIVLALYLKYGFEGMLGRLNGMFAIVIVDLGRNELYITRDRFGIKPMYYVLTEKLFAFSSELKSFRYLEGFDYRLNEAQLDEFLLFRNTLRGTLFKDIVSLDPGHCLVYKADQEPVVQRYFDPDDYVRSGASSGNLDDYGKRMEEWLSKSVRSQLMSDVKLGCQLSGGVDSSLVTWLANRNSEKGSFESVSIVFKDQRFSEEKFIDRVTENLAITSHKFLLDSDYYLDHMERATWHLEAPLNHPNTIGIYKLSQRARDYVTVLLSGEGADEVFGGYSRFYSLSYPYQTRRLLHQFKKNLGHPLDLADYFKQEYRSVMATAFMTPGMAAKLRPGFSKKRATQGRRSLYNSLDGSLFDRQVKYEMLAYLPDLLIRQDKMSMAHSIENRVPFLDNEVVDNAFTVPEKYLLLKESPEGKNTEKYLLKKMTASTFGKDFAFRNKMGFGIPVREFFTNLRFDEYLNDVVLPGIRQRGLFNHGPVSNWLSDVRSLKYNELEALWVLVSFEIWAGIYLDTGNENWNTPH
ncbi:MAG: asparagine synthase (glutamine-hydrolyzing) [Bacteroidales bacterium]|nr:asparagine synthase (glutamine-hydrolyzing) [Bacteroidales bacterium]